ncbi:MAG: glycosyltransferase family 2 protein [Methylobacillus sp.]|jgi:glycosyltransferase involved in cell wall biosynthesis|nr:glycosyltransferase family 2 protein [Methylobacillus sp.]
MTKLSLILPAKNEAAALAQLLPELVTRYPEAEIIVVSDGSSDNTAELVAQYRCRLVEHAYSKGNGAAIKTGARAATGDILVFMDADGQHKPEDIQRLLDTLNEGHDMVVGARSRASQAGVHRATANGFYNRLASWMVGHKISDLTSGFRAVRADKFRQFLYLLPNGFSYPTTITMSFFRAGYSVAYIPIEAPKRIGKSHIRLFKDGMRFLLIIFKIGTLYSPLKLFTPLSAAFFATGLGYYLYTYLTFHRFTNMSALLFITSMLVFLMGLISEQITTLIYKDDD